MGWMIRQTEGMKRENRLVRTGSWNHLTCKWFEQHCARYLDTFHVRNKEILSSDGSRNQLWSILAKRVSYWRARGTEIVKSNINARNGMQLAYDSFTKINSHSHMILTVVFRAFLMSCRSSACKTITWWFFFITCGIVWIPHCLVWLDTTR